MQNLAPITLAGFGAGLFAAAMPQPTMAVGGLATLVGLALMNLSLDLTLRSRGGFALHLSRRPGPARATYAPALAGCVLGGLTSLAPIGLAAAIIVAVLASTLLASLNPRLSGRGSAEIG